MKFGWEMNMSVESSMWRVSNQQQGASVSDI